MYQLVFVGIQSKLVLINCVINVKMLGYDGIDVSEGIDFNKPNASKNVIYVLIDIFWIKVVWFNAKSYEF